MKPFFLIGVLSVLALTAFGGNYVVFYTLPGSDHRHQQAVIARDPASAGAKVTKLVPGAKIVEVKEAPK